MTPRYVTLHDLFPHVSRATLYRWRRTGKLPAPDRVINNRSFYLESRFAPRADDEQRNTAAPTKRQRKAKAVAKNTAEAEA